MGKEAEQLEEDEKFVEIVFRQRWMRKMGGKNRRLIALREESGAIRWKKDAISDNPMLDDIDQFSTCHQPGHNCIYSHV
ncbi:unnamed protein product [Onchocerca flexuosa]|uniref:C3H1-type domain-containing protein n=1 Tax=Onchocerca flexuosa TaxID=387005 RepID=A0A183I5C2_9BILA|nr:unnamed protein product [Onchocerca flexuosa]